MAVIDDLIAQIKAQGTISQWSGSVDSDTALRGMAQRLANEGVTDINQVGMITIPADEEVSPDYANGGYVDKRGNPVDPSIVTVNEQMFDWGPVTSMTAPLGTQVTLGNKATGKPLGNGGYSESVGAGMFGGTTAGKGGTSYNVQFDSAGNPIFYSGKVGRLSTGDFKAALSLAGIISGIGGIESLLSGAGGAGGLSALDAGMDVYGGTGNIGLDGLVSGVELTGTPPPAADLLSPVEMTGTPAPISDLVSPVELTGTPPPVSDLISPVEITGTPPSAIPAATTAAGSVLSVSDAIRLAGIAATVAGAGKLAGSLAGTAGNGAYDIVPVPSDWKSPPPTSVAEFTPLAPIDFGNKEMLRGTQWERLLSPDYGKASPPTQYTQPSNMNFDELTKILGSSRTSVPTQSLSINDVIAGIQSQYGQTPQGSMG
jgi:hypothetical protein